MKRLLSLLIIVSMLSTTLFAIEGIAVSDHPQNKNFGELFLDVDGDELSEEEMKDIDGEGVFATIAIAGGVYAAASSAYKIATRRDLSTDIHDKVVKPTVRRYKRSRARSASSRRSARASGRYWRRYRR